MIAKVLKGIQLVGYQGSVIDNNNVDEIIEEGPKNVEYAKVINFLTNELRSLCSVDEQVNVITGPEDSSSFLMELSSFLKELGCPYESFVQGHISDRLSTKEDKLLLLDYLLTELMAARIMHEKTPEKKIELKLNESSQAASMKKIMVTFGFAKPPANVTMNQLFQKIAPSVQNAIQKAGCELVGDPILNAVLTGKQWDVLHGVQKDLHAEYTIRREMLLKRLDCTIQSFQWSDKTKGKDEQIKKTYTEKRQQLKVEPDVGLADLLSARKDLAIIEKTSNASVRKNTKSSINKVMIGQVPDRGGRTSEQAPPPPEMPSWQQRTAGPPGGRGAGRGFGRGSFGGGDRGGRGGDRGGRGADRGGRGGDRGGRGNSASFDRGGRGYKRGGNSYSGNDYSKSNDNSANYSDYSQPRGNASFDSAGSYGAGKSYQQGGTDYNRVSTSNANKEEYGNNFNRGGNDNYHQNGRDDSYGRGGNYGGGFDSAGSYGGFQDYESNEPKRFKTYDYFQSNKSTHADQYVQESQHNQQYQSRDNSSRGGRGRSSYNRGGNSRNDYY